MTISSLWWHRRWLRLRKWQVFKRNFDLDLDLFLLNCMKYTNIAQNKNCSSNVALHWPWTWTFNFYFAWNWTWIDGRVFHFVKSFNFTFRPVTICSSSTVWIFSEDLALEKSLEPILRLIKTFPETSRIQKLLKNFLGLLKRLCFWAFSETTSSFPKLRRKLA